MSIVSNPAWISKERLTIRTVESIPIDWIEEINLSLSRLVSTEPLVSIVIPAWNEEINVLHAIDSLVRNTVAFPIEIIVVNNNSTDGTQSILDKLNVRSVFQGVQGCGPARQLGQEVALGKYILMADADCFYPPGWIDKMVNELSKDGVSCVYGRHSFLASSKWRRFALFTYECLRDLLIEFRHPNRPYLNALGMNMAYIKEYGLKAGFVTRNIRGEDGRMCFDLMKFGKVVQLRSYSCRVWTWPRTLDNESNLFLSILARIAMEFSRVHVYFTKPRPHNTKTSLNTEPFLLRFFKRYKTFHRKK